MNDIICFSTTTWEPIPTRKQQIMKRMPEDIRIFYVEPPITYIGPLKDKRIKQYLKKYKNNPFKIKENLYVFSLPPIFPFYNKLRIINKINQWKIARYIKKEIVNKFGVKKPILWTYMPNSIDLINKFDKRAVIYDCVDKHSEYNGLINKQVVDKMEEELARKSNIIFTTAEGLYSHLKEYNNNIFLIPNGADFEHFNRARTKNRIPKEMESIKKPILGFVGVIHDWIDLNLIEHLAKKRPELSIVLIGPIGAGVDIETLNKCKNVFFLGRIDYKKLPEYIAQFDICLNVFKVNDLSFNVSPLKFYEYLATGKPIVSTNMPQIKNFSDVVYIAYSYDEFLKKCEDALREDNVELIEKRISYAKAASWQNKVDEMVKILKEEGIIIE